MTIRTGFIGLGVMGKPVAAHLAPAGFPTTVYDIVDEPVDELVAGGAKAASSPREVGANSDIVGICVPEDKHVKALVYGEDGLLAGMSEGGIILIHSTILPETVEEVEAAARDEGIEVMDVCVTGGAEGAIKRTLTLLIGGAESAYKKSQPYFDAITDTEPIFAGPLGCGAKLKLCINLITYIQWAAAYESAALAKSAGLSLDILKQAGQSNGQITPMMLAYLGSQELPKEVIDSEAFQNVMLYNTRLAEKDLAWALKLAHQGEVQLPVGGLVSQLMGRLYQLKDGPRA
ncbi:MAG: NAD(P)-dependent oxidoreductase [bacterium]|nr:NAD(P)-dependent oxidoreductase [bacterium]